MRVAIAGGGTGGHVFPALAVAEELLARAPGSEVLFVGSSGGLEERLIPAHGYRLELLKVGKLKGASSVVRMRTLAGLPGALARALGILRRFDPQVLVGVGGFASGPMALAAWLRHCPVVLLEQNAIPGLTNRVLARLASRVVVSFAEATARFPRGRAVLLGNPLRRPLVAALARSGPPHGAPRSLLVLGGSQGARRVNELMVAAAPAIFRVHPGLRLVHQTGAADETWVAERYREAKLSVEVRPFIDDVAAAYREANLVISRAGATTCAELCLAGKPALLVPYPFAADDHQRANARALESTGGALVLSQQELEPAQLADEVIRLFSDPQLLLRMGAALRTAARPDAAARVVALLEELVYHPAP
ncbi:MAG: undecaprenyldiphospho-muramoylpentapeptide beta-N-acetylglucosaminyltransferase [Deltaproteobacteria bacterium]|nr:undecaprenyldiphospho-muramoylpentapeptide beta-N-acetylglucosaminyltransferase [Deltaproteobacteria bacterium]